MKRTVPARSGSVMIVVIFLLLVMMPILMVFVRWMVSHRRETAMLTSRGKEMMWAGSLAQATRRDAPPTWNVPVADREFTLEDGTKVTIKVQHTSK